MREPSIHIKEKDLGKVLLKLKIKNAVQLAKQILEKGRSFSLNSRGVYVSNDKLLKKTTKVQLAGRSNTQMFAQMLLLVRRQFKHRGLQLIQPGDKDWLNLKEATKLATDFCNEFGMSIKEGYKQYITIAMSMMKHFSIFKFKGLHGPISNRFEAMQEISQDKSPELSEKAHSYYVSTISEKVGFTEHYNDIPEKYVFFVRAKEEAHSIGISIKEYIKAQFVALEWASGIPDPAQLVGTKARQRVQKWAYENGIKLGKASPLVNFKSIKRGKRNKNRRRKQQE